MKINSKDFCVEDEGEVTLRRWATRIKPVYKSEEHYQRILAEHAARLDTQQQLLYASNRYAVLVIFQGMDAAGKDGAIRHVMSGVSPQGCQVFSFKAPSAIELKHDFLWRTNCNLPQRGWIGIFNRSYYEEVLIAQVHPQLLRAEGFAGRLRGANKLWRERYQSINDLEKHLHRNGTRIVKFFLHLSKEEQRKRFLARIDDTEKNWKFGRADINERGFWKQYMQVYSGVLSHTGTHHAPWYVVPADDKKSARLIVSHILLECLDALAMRYPQTTTKRRKELLSFRKQLLK